MIKSVKDSIDVMHELHDKYNVEYRKIVFGDALFEKKKMTLGGVDENGWISVSVGEYKLKIESFNEYYNVEEVLVNGAYEYLLNNEKKDIVFDIGMNIGDATLFFLSNERVHCVYSYEPFRHTFRIAKENLRDYEKSDRLKLFNYGLSDHDETKDIMFNKDMTCAQSVNENVRQRVFEKFLHNNLVNTKNEKMEQIVLKDVSTIGEIIDRNFHEYNIVLKIDCEGAEYSIIERLYETGLLDKVDFIMLEWHYEGKDSLISKIKKSGLSYYHIYKSNEMGLVYAFRTE